MMDISKLYGHKKCDTLYLIIPAKLAREVTFPFKSGDSVVITLGKGSITVRPREKKDGHNEI